LDSAISFRRAIRFWSVLIQKKKMVLIKI